MLDSFVPREAQSKILDYSGGYMGVSAVPGSGKTFTLSLLAANLVHEIAQTRTFDEREVLIVTFTNSGVQNFQNRIAGFLHEMGGLLPGVGYSVRTIHGLAHDIVRGRPALAGLSEDFDIVDGRRSDSLLRDSVQSWLRINQDVLAPYVDLNNTGNRNRFEQDMVGIVNSAIRTLKDERMDLNRLRANLNRQSGTWPLMEYTLTVFEEYQRGLEYLGGVDFDDLIVFAIRTLEADSGYLERLHKQWPYVLEDEAQDSGALQERLLRMLTASHGNWVRVGDPNQAINTTFTSARSSFLTAFIRQHNEEARDLPNSGRSALPIIDTANTLIKWSRQTYPEGVALTHPLIQPTDPDDPQQNPAAGHTSVVLFDREFTPNEEVKTIIERTEVWLQDNPEGTVAILAFLNARVLQFQDALIAADIRFDDTLLRSPDLTIQNAANALLSVLQFLSDPQNGSRLSASWLDAWWPYKGRRLVAHQAEFAESFVAPSSDSATDEAPEPVRTFAAALNQLRESENFLFPAQTDWIDILGWMADDDGFHDIAEAYRSDMQRWSHATILPIEELILTIGNELFDEPSHLALTHYFAVHLSKTHRDNPGWRLPDLVQEMYYIVSNRTRLPTFDAENEGYEPTPGVVTLATLHGAKGLEWDRVYLTSANNYDFPSGDDEDQYRAERFYARDKLNLEAETIEQLRQLNMGTLDDYVEGKASMEARQALAAERLRLFYVGITRARRELIVTYNTGRFHENRPNPPAVAFQALIDRQR